jgi:hypothetical protein
MSAVGRPVVVGLGRAIQTMNDFLCCWINGAALVIFLPWNAQKTNDVTDDEDHEHSREQGLETTSRKTRGPESFQSPRVPLPAPKLQIPT